MPGDAPARRHTAAQRDARTLAATSHSTSLPPLAAAEPRSYPRYHGLPGIKPEQPNPPKETTSSAGPPAPARCRSYARASPLPQHLHQLQESRATSASSPTFPSRPALPHQHHAQPRHQIALFAKSARACMHGSAWMPPRFKVGVRIVSVARESRVRRATDPARVRRRIRYVARSRALSEGPRACAPAPTCTLRVRPCS